MEVVESSSRTQESSTGGSTKSNKDINSPFSRELILSDSSYLSKLHDSLSSDSPSTDIAVSDQVSSPSSPIASQATERDSPDLQKSTNTDWGNISDRTTRDDIKESSTYVAPIAPTTEELSEVTKSQSTSSSTDVSNPVSIDEIWSSDCEYSDSLREFREAFNCAVGTVLDIVKTRICWMCAMPNNTGTRDLEELLRPLPPLLALALKDAAVLMAAQKGEGHALVHLLAVGARGNGSDTEKRNALHLACIGGWDNCVRILLDFKAIGRTRGRVKTKSWDPKTDFEAVDVYSKTPLDYAKENSSSCAYYLERAIELQYDKRVRKVKKKF